MNGPTSIGILGGGTAGYMTALALRRHRPDIDVTLIESPHVPIIGVGEGTTPLMVAFLHGYLGLDVAEFVRTVAPTWKLGVRLEWGAPRDGQFNFAFEASHLVDSYVHSARVDQGSLGAQIMASGGSLAVMRQDLSYESLAGHMPFGYHIDNGRFVEWLRWHVDRSGCRRMTTHISDVELGPDGVAGLRSDTGERHTFDMYVDCSGFRSTLLGSALGTTFVSYADSLPTDRALVGTVPHGDGFGPFTTAETMDAGWCWGLPQAEANHRGYVFCSSSLGSDQAEAEMRSKNPGLSDVRELTFRSGRMTDWWKGNVVGIGNSYAFVEPLEATGLHMAIREIGHMVALLDPGFRSPQVRAQVNTSIASAWDYLRDHLALHYRFNRRVDSDFWRTCAAHVPLGSLEAPVASLLDSGGAERVVAPAGAQPDRDNQAFVLDSVPSETLLLLLGQHAIPSSSLKAGMDWQDWLRHVGRLRAWAQRTASAPSSAAIIAADPQLADPTRSRWFGHLLDSLMTSNLGVDVSTAA